MKWGHNQKVVAPLIRAREADVWFGSLTEADDINPAISANKTRCLLKINFVVVIRPTRQTMQTMVEVETRE